MGSPTHSATDLGNILSARQDALTRSDPHGGEFTRHCFPSLAMLSSLWMSEVSKVMIFKFDSIPAHKFSFCSKGGKLSC
jgi:hypothetical protein